MLERLLHVHLQHVVDVLALEADLQRLAVEAPALADRARHPDVGEEVHLQPVRAVALARLAAAAGLVEAEPARLVAAHLRLGQLREQGADLVEHLDVRRRVRARRAADRRLVDVDDLVDVLGARRCGRSARRSTCESSSLVLVVLVGFVAVRRVAGAQPVQQDVVDQRDFARAADAGDADEQAERDLDVDVLEVVVPGADDREAPCRCAAGAASGRRSALRPVRYWPVRLAGLRDDVGRRAGGDDLAAADAGAGAEVDEVVGGPHRVLVVLDDEDGVAHVAQPFAGCAAGGRCRAGAGRCTARRGCRARRRGRSRSGPARRMRCASPPESVGAERSSVR